MKLRNKKTGEIWDIPHYKEITMDDGKVKYTYKSLAEVNKNWEDYEPLIKDEKIRKAVRAWAEANEEEHVKVKGACMVTEFKGLHTMLGLELSCTWTRDGVYAINELCGEEEE